MFGGRGEFARHGAAFHKFIAAVLVLFLLLPADGVPALSAAQRVQVCRISDGARCCCYADAEVLHHSSTCTETSVPRQSCILKSDCHGGGTHGHPVEGYLVYIGPPALDLSQLGSEEKLPPPAELKPSSLIPPPIEKPPISVAS